MSSVWSLWIIGLTIACLILVTWVLIANSKVAKRDDEELENRTTGHVYDGIEEYDNPLPRWWFNMFILTIVFSIIYLALFPGLGSFPGFLNWSSQNRLAAVQEAAQEQYSQQYADLMARPIAELAEDHNAEKMGVRLFSNHCAVCHGADGGGMFGYPNLRDDSWLWGGSPEAILTSIKDGRQGQMPAWGAALGDVAVVRLAEYVLKVSNQEHVETVADLAAPLYQQYCAACHGADGKGNQALGAPDLTDDAWLYSGTRDGILQTLRQGRAGQMPAHADTLKPEKIHLLAAYVYGLSRYE